MARRSRSKADSQVMKNGGNGSDAVPPRGGMPEMQGAETTGRFLVVFKDEALDSPAATISSLNKTAGIKALASAADYKDEAVDAADVAKSGLYFPELGIAVVTASEDQLQPLGAAAGDSSSNILAIEPEYVFHALQEPLSGMEYLRGYRDAVNHVYNQLNTGSMEDELEEAAIYRDNAQYTWGLQATRVSSSTRSGQGIKVAVLDTGLDLQHPDFAGRLVRHHSFIPGQTVQDGQGHGTHCTGTAAGPQRPPTGVRRYGCAFGASIHIGKVLSNGGSSVGSSVLAGMNWAVANKCQVISMSLGANVNQVSQAFELAGQRALRAGCLIIAAAGNNARRSTGNYGFVGQPANSPSIMAVAALDSDLRVADFSARSSSVTGTAGKIDIAAPGVGVFSSVPRPRLHASSEGTSMATPHVAGIAAMWSQARRVTGSALWAALTQTARRIPGDARDVGSGLVQAP